MNHLRLLAMSVLMFSPQLLWADLAVTRTRCIVPEEANNGHGKLLQEQFAEARVAAHGLTMAAYDELRKPENVELFGNIDKTNALISSDITPAQIQAFEDELTKVLLGKNLAVLEAWKIRLISGQLPEGTNMEQSLGEALQAAKMAVQDGADDKTRFSSGPDPEKQVAATNLDYERFVSKLKAFKASLKEYQHFAAELEESCPGVPGISFENEKNNKKYKFNDCLPVPGTKSGPYKNDAACSYSVACESVSIAGTEIAGANTVMFGVSCEKSTGACPGLVACAKQSDSTVGPSSALPKTQSGTANP